MEKPRHDGLDELRMQARYRRQKRDLYRAKMYGPRPTSPERMRRLEQACELADSRLSRARAAQMID